jgi:guanylate kinase
MDRKVDFERKDRHKQRGILFVISAPSGTGKTTLLKKVIDELPNLRFSISYTTRIPRATERDGEDYFFITQEIFQKMVERDEFLEWAEVLGNYYGTSRKQVESLLLEGWDIILDIDTQGAKKLKDRVDNIVLIYILPPSINALQERLSKRSLDSPDTIKFRLAHARKDIEEACWYHYIIINDRIEDACDKIKAIIIAERCRKMKDSIIEEKKREWEVLNGSNYGRGLP